MDHIVDRVAEWLDGATPADGSPPPETWRPVVGFEANYEVSNLARVRRSGVASRSGKGRGGGAQIGRIIAVSPNWGGYRSVMMWSNGKYYRRLVHVLVARAFLGEPPPKHEVNHLRGKGAGDGVDNLEYLTRSENIIHSYRAGLRKPASAKITSAVAEEIRRVHAEGEFGCRLLAKRYGIAKSQIQNIINGRAWVGVTVR